VAIPATNWTSIAELVKIASCSEENWKHVQKIHRMYLTHRLKGSTIPKAFLKRKQRGDTAPGELPPAPKKGFNPEGLKFLFNLSSESSITEILLKIISGELDTSTELTKFVQDVQREEFIIRVTLMHAQFDEYYAMIEDESDFTTLRNTELYSRIINTQKIKNFTNSLTMWKTGTGPAFKPPVT